jgi:hypothetical protein
MILPPLDGFSILFFIARSSLGKAKSFFFPPSSSFNPLLNNAETISRAKIPQQIKSKFNESEVLLRPTLWLFALFTRGLSEQNLFIQAGFGTVLGINSQ